MRVFLVLFILAYSMCTFANEEPHQDHSVKEEEPIELSEQAVKNFDIRVSKIFPVNKKAEIPLSAIVKSEAKNQIFILHNGKYEIRDINIVKRTPIAVTIDPFNSAEDVVVSGVNYLKVVEMSHGEEGDGGHGH